MTNGQRLSSLSMVSFEAYIQGPKCYKSEWIAHTQEIKDWNMDAQCVLFFGGGKRTIEFRMEKNFHVNLMKLDGRPCLLVLNPKLLGCIRWPQCQQSPASLYLHYGCIALRDVQ